MAMPSVTSRKIRTFRCRVSARMGLLVSVGFGDAAGFAGDVGKAWVDKCTKAGQCIGTNKKWVLESGTVGEVHFYGALCLAHAQVELDDGACRVGFLFFRVKVPCTALDLADACQWALD